MGDSLTFGFGVSRSQCWTRLLEQSLGIPVVNCGVNGDTTGGMLARLHRDVLGKQTNVYSELHTIVLVMGGSNDIFYSGSDEAARANIGALVHQLVASGVGVAAGIPLPVVPDQVQEQWKRAVDFTHSQVVLKRYQVWLRSFCDAFSVPYVSFDQDFLDENGRPIPRLFLDGMHPTPEGHQKMAKRCAAWFRQRIEME